MKKAIVFMFFSLVSIFLHSQTMRSWGWQVLDTAYLVCQYKYSHYAPIIDAKQKDVMKLEIGKKLSKFYSNKTFLFDSISSLPNGGQIIKENFEAVLKRHSQAPKKEQMNILLDIPGRASRFMIYKNYEKGQLLVQDQEGEYYQYEDTLGMQQWEIVEDTMTILGYPCQKAACRWRGRTYSAWFTPEIPISEGPYKFVGLPGLILKVEDRDQKYCFEIEEIQKVSGLGIYLAQPLEKGEHYKDSNWVELYHKREQSSKNLIRRINRDMQRLGKDARLSEKKDIDMIELLDF